MMSRRLALLVAVLALVVGAWGAPHVHTYRSGAFIDLPAGHWCGVEIAPTPGPFCDVD